MSEYRTVEGDLDAAAVDTLTNLTTFGGETSVGPVKVPANTSRLVEIWIAPGVHIDTATDEVGIIMRLSGKGMAQGDQDFVVAGGGGGVTNTGTAIIPATILPVDLSVTPNENINVAVAAVGDDVALAWIGITLVFA